MEFGQYMTTGLHLRFVAETPEKQRNGLMHQPPLSPNEGALFVYPELAERRFWNKNVGFPIDVGFFDEERRLVNVETLDAGQEDGVGHDAQYVLEAPRGFFIGTQRGASLDDMIQ